jgi:hypothetical protein
VTPSLSFPVTCFVWSLIIAAPTGYSVAIRAGLSYSSSYTRASCWIRPIGGVLPRETINDLLISIAVRPGSSGEFSSRHATSQSPRPVRDTRTLISCLDIISCVEKAVIDYHSQWSPSFTYCLRVKSMINRNKMRSNAASSLPQRKRSENQFPGSEIGQKDNNCSHA